eukprot:TRINITY_DN7183_c0_g1_i1.p1 TRINITY_DN7183_c0_g1~~TRINITY_DN7183_c0_g1_i1.p1  ORF type:complete len:514 (+),score=94.56 TRINITY_DN7183_c0_g1_i1:142-1683(+)
MQFTNYTRGISMKRFAYLDSEGEDLGARVSCVSWNMLGQYRISESSFPYCNFDKLHFNYRKDRLMKMVEDLSTAAEVFCFQEIDDYFHYWKPRMEVMGYIGLHAKADSSRCALGLFCRKDHFDVIKTEVIDFNVLVDKFNNDKCAQDTDLAQLVMLQPWGKVRFQCPILFVNCVLNKSSEYLKEQQLRYLMERIQQFNKDLTCPTIICGTVNFDPKSRLYKMMTTSIIPRVPVLPEIPARPRIIGASRTNVRLSWKKPNHGDEAIDSYHIYVRPKANIPLPWVRHVSVDVRLKRYQEMLKVRREEGRRRMSVLVSQTIRQSQLSNLLPEQAPHMPQERKPVHQRWHNELTSIVKTNEAVAEPYQRCKPIKEKNANDKSLTGALAKIIARRNMLKRGTAAALTMAKGAPMIASLAEVKQDKQTNHLKNAARNMLQSPSREITKPFENDDDDDDSDDWNSTTDAETETYDEETSYNFRIGPRHDSNLKEHEDALRIGERLISLFKKNVFTEFFLL